ncbi:hypothetical protein WJX72_001739 [[Myrmecia] bisecta]|uniref:SRP54-type proteins GTP-binding domain-containing protein n=1 Tax=[Myrmecia] bisecta TaxID=41462 RepID=A0AAW1PJZ3_9CHLO
MLILLSPAKTLNMSKSSHQLRATPPFAKDGEVLVQELAKLSLAGMKSLLGVSDAIARLNHERYQHWEQQPSKQAVLAFDGPAYKGLDAPSLSDEDLQWAQERLRILCGLYGILRPMDAIKPYRLDMSKKLANAKWKDLYAFWGGSLTLSLNAELLRMPEDERFVVNCASQEYFKAIQPADLAGPVYTMAFPGPSVFAKQARGAMVRYIIKERVTTPEGLKGFTGTSGEWQFDDGQSKHSEFVFVRTAGKATSKAAGKAAAKPAAQRRKPRSGRSLVVQAQASAGGVGVFQKLGRVLKEKAQGDLDRIFKGASKTREKLGVVDELLTYWNLEDAEDTLEELEEALITADFGPRTALKIVDVIRTKIENGDLKTGADIRRELKSSIVGLLTQRGGSSELSLGDTKPAVVLVVGVNGGGKTTSIGKLSHKLSQQGAKVLLAAGDTFRAAAAEQLAEWAERSGSQIVVAKNNKQRPDSLMYETVDRAMREELDVVICDTSGRLHTNTGLMEELAKSKRAIGKRLPGAPHEVILVLDGTTGLNMLNQAREFHQTVGLTGIILTKLDGTARGGAVVSVVDELGIPIKFVGVGETVEDLQPFDAQSFVDALFPAS